MKSRNPIARVIRKIRPQVVPDKRRKSTPLSKEEMDELHEYARKKLDENNGK